MCGILGAFTHNPPPDFEARLQGGLKAMHHRGPDDRGLEVELVAGGTLALGHTRLSITPSFSTGRSTTTANCVRNSAEWATAFAPSPTPRCC
jgi:asparagine synthetase B (glutamine-hydrolysing)